LEFLEPCWNCHPEEVVALKMSFVPPEIPENVKVNSFGTRFDAVLLLLST
jgi:hypothetical protein